MGAGASAQREEMTKVLPKCSDYEGCYTMIDETGEGIDLAQLEKGIEKLGLTTIKKEDIPELFKKFKAGAAVEKKNKYQRAEPKISEDEFMKFMIVEHSASFAEQEDSKAISKKYSDLHGLLGPIEATHGFTTALNVLGG